MADYSQMTVNAQVLRDLVYHNSEQIGEYRLVMKQDLKRCKFGAEKRCVKMTDGDELRDMIARAQVEEEACKLRYEQCLEALKAEHAAKLEAETDPEKKEALKTQLDLEMAAFTGRDDKILKVKHQAQLAQLKEDQATEKAELIASHEAALSATTDPAALKALKKEQKAETKAQKTHLHHEMALLVMKQRQEDANSGYYITKQRAHKSSQKRNRIIANTGVYALLIIISIIWLLPFVFIILQSLRTEDYRGVSGYLFTITRTYDDAGNLISRHAWLGWDNYKALFTTDSVFFKWYLNTFIIAISTAAGQTIFVLLVSYGLSRLRFRGRKMLMNIMLVLGMFPGFLTMIILYWMLNSMGLTQEGAIGGLILVNIASSGMGYYVCKGFFDTIPRSLDEAARIDGATRWQVLYKVIIPMSGPIIVYVILTAFMGPWADYIFASYIAFGNEGTYNVAVGLYTWLTNDQIGSHYTEFCAGGVLVAIPVTVLFMCLQRFYVEGVTGGAVKG